ncbi:MAG TPA: YitT family protein [Propionicimonas sp.]|mgnify:CR=1 FL=1|nr:YitT family protein [Propionicimonas sp.]
MTQEAAAATSVPQRHGPLEDLLGLATGIVVASLGLALLRSVSAVTGGTAGLSLLLHYATGWEFGPLFSGVSVPFFLLAIRLKGWRFTLRSAVTVVCVSLLSSLQPGLLGPLQVQPWYAVVVGNLLVGMAILVLFRHGSSVGGFSIVALISQERLGWRAGYVQMALDLAVILASFWVVSPAMVAWSALGGVVVNLVLAFNHKPGRYLGF